MPAERPAAKWTLILIPGLLCDAAVWQHQIGQLGGRFEILVPDLTGHSSIDEMSQAVLALAPPRFSVAGHSMGARVALRIVGLAPDRVERLALLDTGVHPRREGEADARQALLDVSAGRGMGALADRWLPPMVAEGALEVDPALQSALRAMVMRMTPEIHRNQVTALLDRPDARAELGAIRCPVLIGVGEQDRWSPPAQHREILGAIPHAKLVVFQGSGHMAPMEAPEEVTSALLSWMSWPVQGGVCG